MRDSRTPEDAGQHIPSKFITTANRRDAPAAEYCQPNPCQSGSDRTRLIPQAVEGMLAEFGLKLLPEVSSVLFGRIGRRITKLGGDFCCFALHSGNVLECRAQFCSLQRWTLV